MGLMLEVFWEPKWRPRQSKSHFKKHQKHLPKMSANWSQRGSQNGAKICRPLEQGVRRLRTNPLGEGLPSPLTPLPNRSLQPTQQKIRKSQSCSTKSQFSSNFGVRDSLLGLIREFFSNKLHMNFTFFGLSCFAWEVWRCM